MKERPILFSAPMVRAILDGSKTQTRRVVRRQPENGWAFEGVYGRITSAHSKKGKFGAFLRRGIGSDFPQADIEVCPYGQPGDRLYIRETWRTTGDGGRADYLSPRDLQPHKVWYDADGPAPADECVGKTRVSIHMPRWACRIVLEIVSVRVERLNDCSDADALAEGVDRTNTSIAGYAKERYHRLWESINGTGSWEANPWVWVVEFKRVLP